MSGLFISHWKIYFTQELTENHLRLKVLLSLI